jgi:hypothetical protein
MQTGQSLQKSTKIGSKLSHPTKISAVAESTSKTVDGSSFKQGQVVLWTGYSKYVTDSPGILVILTKPFDYNNTSFDFFDNCNEPRWVCLYLTTPDDAVIIRESELLQV